MSAMRAGLEAGVLCTFWIAYATRRSRSDLVDAIAAVLAEQRHRLPTPGKRPTGWGPSIHELRPVAECVVARLLAEGYEVEVKPPAAGHRTP